jgi:hypothetical protein
MDSIPHLAWPIRFTDTGQYVTVQQDTDDEVAQCVGVLVSYLRGFRIERPDFGIFDPTFNVQPIDTSDIGKACAIFEARADVDLEEYDDPNDRGKTTVRLRVTVPTSDELPQE